MKKIILPLISAILMSVSVAADAAGIKFEKGDWASVKAKAQSVNKPIMVDFYTSWCVPCKQMEKNIFPMDSVGEFYNANFVNYKVDAEEGEGPELAEQFSVQAYPTFIYTDSNGKFLHQAVGGSDAEGFVQHGCDALDPIKQLAGVLAAAEGNQSEVETLSTLRKLKAKRMPYADKFQSYIESLPESKRYTREIFDLLVEFGGRSAEGFAFETILSNKAKYTEVAGEDLNNYLYRAYYSKAASLNNRQQSYEPVIQEVKAAGFDFADRITDTIELNNLLHRDKDFAGYLAAVDGYIDRYAKNDLATLHNVVFNEAAKFMFRDPALDTFVLKVADQLIAAKHREASVLARLGMKYARAGQLEKGLGYYQDALASTEGQGEMKQMLEQSVNYLQKRVAVMASGEYEYSGQGFDEFNGYIIKFHYASPTQIGKFDESNSATIKDGQFVLSGKVTSPVPAVWAIYNGKEFIAKGSIIVEPGQYPMVRKGGNVSIENATYHYYLNTQIADFKPYKDALAGMREVDERTAGREKTPEERAEWFDHLKQSNELREQHYRGLLDKNPDPMVKLLACLEGYLYQMRSEGPVKPTEEYLALKAQFGDHYLIRTMDERLEKSEHNRQMQTAAAIGNVIKDFTARDHDGKEFRLANVLKKNKYVLVEFWASWCGPCRGEIPHMKTAYKHFNDKGFEIVSYSLDDDKEAWDEAYEEEGITWIDTSDLMYYDSPIAKMFGVSGVPANYLVEGETGKIIAKDLRGEKLDQKLAELLGE